MILQPKRLQASGVVASVIKLQLVKFILIECYKKFPGEKGFWVTEIFLLLGIGKNLVQYFVVWLMEAKC